MGRRIKRRPSPRAQSSSNETSLSPLSDVNAIAEPQDESLETTSVTEPADLKNSKTSDKNTVRDNEVELKSTHQDSSTSHGKSESPNTKKIKGMNMADSVGPQGSELNDASLVDTVKKRSRKRKQFTDSIYDYGPSSFKSKVKNNLRGKRNRDTISERTLKDGNTVEGVCDERNDGNHGNNADADSGRNDEDSGEKEDEMKFHDCGHCNQIFMTAKDLRTHKCKEESLCQVCGEVFYSECKLDRHMRRHHSQQRERKTKVSSICSNYVKVDNDGKFECTVCHHKLRSKVGMRLHVIQKHLDEDNGKLYICEVCGRTFKTAVTFNQHARVHTGEKPFECMVCHKRFSQSCNLRAHMVIHSGVKPYKCDVCGVGFTQKGNLKKHKEVRHTEVKKKHQCDICQKKYISALYLSVHRKTHGEIVNLDCHICGRTFCNARYLAKHKAMHKESNYNVSYSNQPDDCSPDEHSISANYNCLICLKEFVSKIGYEEHMARHENKKFYNCKECGKGFDYRRELRVHMVEHTGKHPYHCKECDVKFKSCHAHKMHDRRFHTTDDADATNYVCKFCGAKHGSSSHLATHIRSHTGEKPYKCTDCSKCFAQIATLQNHRRIHTGERPFVCDICQKSFVQRTQLNNHKRRCALDRDGNPITVRRGRPSPVKKRRNDANINTQSKTKSNLKNIVMQPNLSELDSETSEMNAENNSGHFVIPAYFDPTVKTIILVVNEKDTNYVLQNEKSGQQAIEGSENVEVSLQNEPLEVTTDNIILDENIEVIESLNGLQNSESICDSVLVT